MAGRSLWRDIIISKALHHPRRSLDSDRRRARAFFIDDAKLLAILYLRNRRMLLGEGGKFSDTRREIEERVKEDEGIKEGFVRCSKL